MELNKSIAMFCVNILCLLPLSEVSTQSTPYINHLANYVNLVSAYFSAGHSTTDFLPLQDHSKTMEVEVSFSLYAINGFDEVAGNIELVAALDMAWTDQTPTIHSITFRIQGRDSFLVPYDKIWTPKLILTNAIGESSEVGDEAYLCRFNMTNYQVNWRPRIVISASCSPDVTFYPFDRQECQFIFAPWGFKDTEVLITTQQSEWDMSEYEASGEWDIDSTETTTYISNNQSYIALTIGIIRKPLYFAFNILLPVLVLCLLNSTVFLLPAESGERVGFSVTCFLSFVVLLNMIMDIMPRSSNPISFLCYYLVVMMCTSGGMTLITILMMRVYHKPEKEEVPKWLQRFVTFINCGCARLRCCVLCCRFLKRQCSCKDRRWCRCKNTDDVKLKEVKVEKPDMSESEGGDVETDSDTPEPAREVKQPSVVEKNTCFSCFAAVKGKCVECKEKDKSEEKDTILKEQKRDENANKLPDDKSTETTDQHGKCFPFFRNGKISNSATTKSPNKPSKPPKGQTEGDKGEVMKKRYSGLTQSSGTEEALAAARLEAWVDSTADQTGKKGNSLEPIEDAAKLKQADDSDSADLQIDELKETGAKREEDTKAKVTKSRPKSSKRRSSRTPSLKNPSRRNSTMSAKRQALSRRKSLDPTYLLKQKLLEAKQEELDLDLLPAKEASKRRASSASLKREHKTSDVSSKNIETILKTLDLVSDSEKDSLADLEEEVTWAEVGRVCDTFFLLAFSAGEAFFTVVFLVPLFTANA